MDCVITRSIRTRPTYENESKTGRWASGESLEFGRIVNKDSITKYGRIVPALRTPSLHVVISHSPAETAPVRRGITTLLINTMQKEIEPQCNLLKCQDSNR